MRITGSIFLIFTSVLCSLHAEQWMEPITLDPLTADEPFSTNSLQGSIVVLDFFASWCKPCAKVTPLLEEEIDEYYRTRGGNANGVTVRLIPVNVDARSPRKTLRFLERLGVTNAWQDSDGKVFEQIGQNKGLPLIVVLDLTTDLAKEKPVKVVYTQAGKPDVRAVRQLIDQIKPTM